MRKMGIGLGVGINRSNYAQGIFNAYSARVVADGGVVEAGSCVDAVSGILLNASLLLIPSGYKANKLYSEIPTNGNGDLTWTRTSTAIRTNSSSLLESMATGVPRLSYMYGSCPSALLEPQRTNLALYSEQFNDASWTKVASSITANTTTAPDGNTTADSLLDNNMLGFHYATQLNVGSGTVTMSVYAKPNGRDWLYLHAYNVSGGDKGAYFNVSSGTIGTIDSGISASIQSASNGFYRCQITYTNANPMQIVLSLANANNGRSYTGDGTKGLYIWGAQSEVGAYPTTYIPTTSATATRVADSFSRNNIYTNGLISASGGTWFVEFRNNILYTRDNTSGFFIGDSTTANTGNQIIIRNSGISRLTIFKYVSGTSTNLYATTTDTTKIAIKWNGTSADIFVNGTKQVSATSFTTTIMENLVGGNGVPYFIQQMALFSTPLSDTDCTTLTT